MLHKLLVRKTNNKNERKMLNLSVRLALLNWVPTRSRTWTSPRSQFVFGRRGLGRTLIGPRPFPRVRMRMHGL